MPSGMLALAGVVDHSSADADGRGWDGNYDCLEGEVENAVWTRRVDRVAIRGRPGADNHKARFGGRNYGAQAAHEGEGHSAHHPCWGLEGSVVDSTWC